VNVSTPFIHRPVATTLLMAGLLLFGSVAYFLLPDAPLPRIDFPTIVVTAQSPGTSPVTMALSVATPLERQFAQISGVSRLASSSGIGTATIMIQFARTRDIDAAAQDVQSAIDAVAGQLPKNLPSPPIYKKIDATQAKGAPTRTIAAQPGAPIQ
jgi:multidrug efflux pump subunit AcrB